MVDSGLGTDRAESVEREYARVPFHRKPLETFFAVAALLFFTDAIRVLVQNPAGEGTVSFGRDFISRPGMVFIYATTLALLALRWRSVASVARLGAPTLVLLGVACSSVLWSTDARVSLKNCVWLAGTTAFGVYLHVRFSARQQLVLIGIALWLVVASSYLFALALPDLGIDPGLHAGAWRGVFIHKNSLGRLSTLSVVVFLLLARSSGPWSVVNLAWAAAALALLGLSQSASAALVLACCIPLLALGRLVQTGALSARLSVGLLVLGVVAAGVTALVAGSDVLGLLGRDSSLTGRSVLWGAVALEILERPWLGYGYHAFWNGATDEFATVWAIVRWAPPHAHNGFLDLLLQFGVIGATTFLIVYGKVMGHAARHFFRARSAGVSQWPMMFLAYHAVSNISESTFLRHTSIFWVLFVATALQAVSDDTEHPRDATLAAANDPTVVRGSAHP
jgi:exopolysaccharide production protein ExoQ